MKLHKISYIKDGEPRQQFASSDSDASKMCTELKKDNRVTEKPTRAAVDIPTDKTGLLAYLNAHCTRAEPL